MTELKHFYEDNIKCCRLNITKLYAMLTNHRLKLTIAEREIIKMKINDGKKNIAYIQRLLDEIYLSVSLRNKQEGNQ
jgi:hypothetical protein